MDNKEKLLESGAKVTKVPPDGGWGYAVALGFTLVMVSMGCHSNSFGLLFKEFLEERGQPSSALTSVLGVSAFTMAFMGLLLNVAYKKFTVRKIAVTGAILYTSGWFFNMFITNVNQILLTNGLLVGAGMGILMNASLTSLNAYFLKKRILALAVVMSMTNIASVCFPFLLEFMNDRLDFRGVMAIMTVIASHTIAGALFYQPVEWHLVEKIEYPTKNEEDKDKTGEEKDEDVESCMKPLNEEDCTNVKRKSFIEIAEDDVLSKMDEIKGQNQMSEILSLDKKTLWEKIVELMSLQIMKDKKFWIVCSAKSFMLFSDLQFFAMQPFLLLEHDLTTEEIAKCASLLSISLLLGKICIVIIGKFVEIKAINLMSFTFVLTFILRLVYLQQTSFIGFAVMNCLLAFPKSWFFICMPVIWAELYPKDYSYAFGFGFFICGSLVGVLSPSAGIIRNISGSYMYSYYFMTIITAIAFLPFAIKFYIMDRRKSPDKVENVSN